MSIRISVIIPFFNNADTIERALKSLRSQRFKIFEVLIINDYSYDWVQAEKIINQFDDLPIILLSHIKNKNGAAARNTGIKKASGEFIAFLDADDEWNENHLLNYVNQLNLDNRNKLHYCKSIIKTDNFDDIIMPEKGLENEVLSEYLFCKNGFIQTSSFFIRSEIAKQYLFDEKLIRHQDYDFLFSLNENGIGVSFSPHIGVIIHWENNDVVKKGGTWEYSLEWAKSHRHYFNDKAFSYFILKHVSYLQFREKNRMSGLKILYNNIDFWSIDFKDWLLAISMLIYGQIKLPWRRK